MVPGRSKLAFGYEPNTRAIPHHIRGAYLLSPFDHRIEAISTTATNSPQAPGQWKETTAEHVISAFESRTLDTYT